MKKRLFAILGLVLAFVMGLSASGCNLVTTNSKADLAQVVATVQISEDAPKTEIKKQEMIMAYINYGYYTYTDYTQEQIYSSIISNLVNSAALVQSAMQEFDKGESPFEDVYKNANITDKWNPERYLSTQNVTENGEVVKLSAAKEVEYQAIKYMNDFIEGYKEADEEGVSDTMTQSTRTAPENAENEDTLTPQKKLDYIEKGIDVGANDSKTREAYVKVLKILKNNELLGDDYNGDIKKSDYYKNIVKSFQESEIIDIYENCINAAERSKITFADLEANYSEMYNEQKDYTASEFASAVSDATYDNPLVYFQNGGYGYVYNLLLGVNDMQSAQISALTGSKAEKSEARRAILEGVTVKDLRSSWILAGYDFDLDSKKFTGDYTLTEAAASLPFEGTVERVKEKDEEKGTNAEYRVKATEKGLEEFVTFMDAYLGVNGTAGTGDIYRTYKGDTAAAQFEERVCELLFAYSTDPGSLNTYKGYVISPSVLGEETYVQEFADAGRELISSDKEYNYTMVATDYGYHVMFYIKALNAGDYATLKDYLDSLDSTRGGFATWEEYYADMLENWDDEDADTDFYLYKLQSLYADNTVSAKLSLKESGIIEALRKDDSKIKIYTERYEDLLG